MTPSNLNRTNNELQQKASSCCLLLYLYVNIFRLKLCLSLPHILIKEWKLKKETHILNHSLESKGQRRERGREMWEFLILYSTLPQPLVSTNPRCCLHKRSVKQVEATLYSCPHSWLGLILWAAGSKSESLPNLLTAYPVIILESTSTTHVITPFMCNINSLKLF